MNLERIRALVCFHANGNLAKAASSLGISQRTLRGRIAALEDEVGVSLVQRAGRLLTLTKSGVALARGGRDLIRGAEAAIERIVSSTEQLVGSFRVAIPVGLPPPLLVMVLRYGHTRFPKLRSQIYPVARPLALLPDEADIAVTLEPRPTTGPWLSARIARVWEGLFATRDYLAREGTPRCLEDLHGHDLFSWTPPGHPPEQWPLSEGGSFGVNLAHSSPDVGLIRQCAAAGLGIARFPKGEIPNPVATVSLEPVLPEFVRQVVPVTAVMPDTPRMRRIFLAFFGNVRDGVRVLADG